MAQKGEGYIGFVCAVNRAIVEGKPMHDPRFYGRLTSEEAKHIFRSDSSSSLPLLEERLQVLRDVASVLESKYGGSFERVLAAADGDALKLVAIVTKDFQCFRDYATYKVKM